MKQKILFENLDSFASFELQPTNKKTEGNLRKLDEIYRQFASRNVIKLYATLMNLLSNLIEEITEEKAGDNALQREKTSFIN